MLLLILLNCFIYLQGKDSLSMKQKYGNKEVLETLTWRFIAPMVHDFAWAAYCFHHQLPSRFPTTRTP